MIRRPRKRPRILTAVAASGRAAATNDPSGAIRAREIAALPICVVNCPTIPGVGQSIATCAVKLRSFRPPPAIRSRTERSPPGRPA